MDENWKPGADFKECQAAGIQRFPTIKFFPPGAKTGEDFFLDRTPENLVDFAKTGITPEPGNMARLPGDISDMKLVDFYAEGCAHCKHLEPIWDDAHKQWDKAIGQTEGEPRDDLPLVTFEKKQCYDDHWKPGKDNAECQKFHVDAFPTIKLFVPDSHGHGFSSMDFTGKRTPEGIVEFLKQQTGFQEALDAKAAHAADLHAPTPAADAAAHASAHGPGPVGVQVPDAVKAEVMAAGEHVPESVKVAAAEHHAQQAGGEEDLLALQGNTPHIGDKHAEVAATVPPPAEVEKLPDALAHAVKTAIMPLQVLSCMPVRKVRTAPASPQRSPVQAAPPAATAQFL